MNRKNRDGLGNNGMDSSVFANNDELGSESGVPDTSLKVGQTDGLSWAPITDSLRDRWNTCSSSSSSSSSKPSSTPWKTSKRVNEMMDENDTVVTELTEPSTVASSVASSSLSKQPTLPSGFIINDKKSCLREFYFKRHQIQIITRESYFTWPDPNGYGHCRRFTCVFVCPITGELFSTGKYGEQYTIKKRKDPLTLEMIQEKRANYIEILDEHTGANVVWFSDKSGAQHGAAARAYDCLSLRMYKPQGMNSVHIGHEEPYMTEQEAPPLPTIPNEERNKIEAERQRITNRRIATDGIESGPTDTSPSVAPKAALAAWYGTKPRSHQLRKNYFVSWTNFPESHSAKYTSVFVCPLTGEVFWSGRYGSVESFEDCLNSEGYTIVWYNKKSLAEHAAAARAYDCWSLRMDRKETNYFGRDEPYLAGDALSTRSLYVLPADVQEKVYQLQEDARTRMPIPILNQKPPLMPTEEEAKKDRDEYRAARVAPDVTRMDEEEE